MGVFKKPKTQKAPELPPAPPPPPKVTDNSAALRAAQEAVRLRRRATALASPASLAAEPNMAKKAALGV